MKMQNLPFSLPLGTIAASCFWLAGCATPMPQAVIEHTNAQSERTEMIVLRSAQVSTVAHLEAEEGTFIWRPQITVTQPSKLIKP